MRSVLGGILLAAALLAPQETGQGTAKSSIARVVVLGASLSSGFGLPRGLDAALDASLEAEHEPVRAAASEMFFLNPLSSGPQLLERALEAEPTLVVALDYLFWFGYGTIDAQGGPLESEEERAALLEKGLASLDELELPSFVKTSGATGIHIYVPIARRYTFDESRGFDRLDISPAQLAIAWNVHQPGVTSAIAFHASLASFAASTSIPAAQAASPPWRSGQMRPRPRADAAMAAYRRGVVARNVGDHIILSPPLIFQRKHTDVLTSVLAESIAEVAEGLRLVSTGLLHHLHGSIEMAGVHIADRADPVPPRLTDLAGLEYGHRVRGDRGRRRWIRNARAAHRLARVRTVHRTPNQEVRKGRS